MPASYHAAPARATPRPARHRALRFALLKTSRTHFVPAWRERLHAYLGGIVRNLGGVAEAVGGVDDHVHLLIGLRATHCLADVVGSVKAVSSRWVHEEIGDGFFSWQEGYGGFTVSPPQCVGVRGYIERQEEHHRKQTYQDEYLEFLRLGGVECDERYLW